MENFRPDIMTATIWNWDTKMLLIMTATMPATATLTGQIYTQGLTFYSKNTSQEGLATKIGYFYRTTKA